MPNDKKFEHHANRIDRMADTQGVDLDEAVLRGDLSPEELEKSVFTCLGCSQTDACERWLSVSKQGAEAAPGFCRNEVLFKALRE